MNKTLLVMTTPKTPSTKKKTIKPASKTITANEVIMMRLEGQTNSINELYDNVEFLHGELDIAIKIIGGMGLAALMLGITLAVIAILHLF